jgi:hypothetical protein
MKTETFTMVIRRRATQLKSAWPSAPERQIQQKFRVQARAQSNYAARKTAESAAASEPAGPTKDEVRAKAAERSQKCDTYKARLQKFVQSRRLYKEDENGERVYLDEQQSQAARERVENQVQEYCSS